MQSSTNCFIINMKTGRIGRKVGCTIILLLKLLVHCLCSRQLHLELHGLDEDRYRRGEAKLTEFRVHAQASSYGDCWSNALSMLDTGCKHLNEDMQQSLAIEFSHCFLLKAGRPTEKCASSEASSVCTRRMQPEAFQAYTEFFTHTQNICFYLQSKLWQEQTENIINRLTDNSVVVSQQLENATELQSELLRKQNASLNNQIVLIHHGEELQKTLEESKNDVRSMMVDLQKSTQEQRTLIFEVFDRVQSLRSLVMGEFTGFYSLIFFFLAILIAYLLTSTPRTCSSRFWIFVLLTCNIICEWMIAYVWCCDSDKQDLVTGQLLDENVSFFVVFL